MPWDIARDRVYSGFIDWIMVMASTRESDIQSLILIYVTSLPGSYFWRQNTGVFNDEQGRRRVRACPKGTPDIIGALKGRFIAIEVKRGKGGVHTVDQKNWQRNCERAGGLYILARSAYDVYDRLRDEGLV